MTLVQEAFLHCHQPLLILSWSERHTFARISEKDKSGSLIKDEKNIVILSSTYTGANPHVDLSKTTNTHLLVPTQPLITSANPFSIRCR